MKQTQYSSSTPVSDRDSHVRGDLTVLFARWVSSNSVSPLFEKYLILSVQLSESSYYNTKTSMSVAANVRPLVAKKHLQAVARDVVIDK